MSSGYRPDGMSMWDTWFIERNGEVHMFYLQRLAPGSQRRPEEQDWIGHAVSTDLLHWKELPAAFGPGPQGSMDDLQPWTGCVTEHDGRFYMHYTMRSSREDSRAQRIGLVISDDLYEWRKYEGNPVILPDPKYYVSHDCPMPFGKVDCRDLITARNPDGDGWVGLHAACVHAEEEAESAVIATVRSRDLIHWEHLPPAFAPRHSGEVELPDLYEIDGRWYMTCLSSRAHGNRGNFSDPNVVIGTMYAVSDSPTGPFEEIEGDNVLMGGDLSSGFSCRSVVFEGERYVLYHQHGDPGGATVAPPMLVTTLPDGRLRLAWSDRLTRLRTRQIIDPACPPDVEKLPWSHESGGMPAGRWRLEGGVYVGESRSGWQIADLGIGAPRVEISATVTLRTGVAGGLAFIPNSGQNAAAGNAVVAIDAAEHCAFATSMPFFLTPSGQGKRSFHVERGRPYHLRVMVHDARYEVFIDDILVVQTAIPPTERPAPSVGLFVDRGSVLVEGLTAYELEY